MKLNLWPFRKRRRRETFTVRCPQCGVRGEFKSLPGDARARGNDGFPVACPLCNAAMWILRNCFQILQYYSRAPNTLRMS